MDGKAGVGRDSGGGLKGTCIRGHGGGLSNWVMLILISSAASVPQLIFTYLTACTRPLSVHLLAYLSLSPINRSSFRLRALCQEIYDSLLYLIPELPGILDTGDIITGFRLPF